MFNVWHIARRSVSMFISFSRCKHNSCVSALSIEVPTVSLAVFRLRAPVVLNHSAVWVSQTDRLIWPQSGRRMRNRANDYMLIQYLSRNPFCSHPVDPLPAALSGSWEDICFLHPSSLIHKATTSVRLHSALSRPSSPLLFQLKPPRHAAGAWASASYYYGGVDGTSSVLTPRRFLQVHSAVATTSYAGPGSG